MVTVNERTSITVTLQFTDVNGNPVIPNSVNYQITDEETETVLSPWTVVNPSASSYDLQVAAGVQEIVNDCNEYEIRRISVISLYNSSTQQATGEFKYRVKNLRTVFENNEIVGSGGAVGGGSAGS